MHARLLWLLVLLVWLPELWQRGQPFLFALDHCEGIGCDFLTYYLPMAQALAERRIPVGWTSPPLLALFFALPWSFIGWMCTLLLAMLTLGVLAASEAGAAGWALVLLSLPAWHALKWGQPSLLLGLLGIAGIRLPRWRGLLAGLGGGLKLYPLLWLTDALFHREWTTILIAAGSGILFGVGIPLLGIGPAGTLAYWKNLWRFQHSAMEATLSAAGLGGQGLPVLLYRLGLPTELAWLLPLSCFFLFRRMQPLPAGALAMTAGMLALQPGWHHYFAFLPWVQAVAWGRGERLWVGVSVFFSALVLLLLPWLPSIYVDFTRWHGTTVAVVAAGIALVRVGSR